MVLFNTAVYSIANAPVGYFWYQAPGFFAFNIVILFGFVSLYSFVKKRFLTIKILAKIRWVQCLSILVCVFVVTEFGLQPFRGFEREFDFSKKYRLAASWIKNKTSKQARIAAVEIGYIGYFSEREIVDIHGIIHPDKFNVIKQDVVDWWLYSDPPDYLIAHNPPWPSEPVNDPKWWPTSSWEKFHGMYVLAADFDSLQIYQIEANKKIIGDTSAIN